MNRALAARIYVGGAIAAACAVLVGSAISAPTLWIAPPAAVSLYLAYRAYGVYLGRIEAGRLDAKRMCELHLATIEALALAIDAKDQTAPNHIRRVQAYAAGLAGALGMSDDEVQGVKTAALLHDIGKLSVPNRILDKPARLTPAEWEIVKLHPYYTHQILERVPVFGELAFDASAHHERFDGRGYSRNLPASQLSEPARILCAADQLDALSAERPYRGKLPPERVMDIMRGERGIGLWPDAVDAACRVFSALN